MRQIPTQIATVFGRLMLFVTTSFALWSCAPVDYDRELLVNMEKWESAAISSYELDMERACFCSDYITRPMHLIVTNGEPTLTYADDGSAVTDEALESLFVGAVPKMFDGISLVLSHEPDRFLVEYNDALGFPERIGVDFEADAIDDELSFWVTNFEIADD